MTDFQKPKNNLAMMWLLSKQNMLDSSVNNLKSDSITQDYCMHPSQRAVQKFLIHIKPEALSQNKPYLDICNKIYTSQFEKNYSTSIKSPVLQLNPAHTLLILQLLYQHA